MKRTESVHPQRRTDGLVPYHLILRVTQGDEDALPEIIPYFGRTIRRMSTLEYVTLEGKRNFHVDEDIRGDLESTLMLAALNFRILI